MKIRVTKIFSFEMAHALYGYDGPCKNIHGHSYSLKVTVIGSPMNNPGHPKNGMVMDFSELKKIVKERIIDEMDHALVLNGNSPHKNISDLKLHFQKVIFVDYQPTCENLLLDLKGRIETALPKYVSLHSMQLQETANSYAEWHSEDVK